jgi:hypothetical protein
MKEIHTDSAKVTETNPIYSDFSVVISDIYKLPEFLKFTEWYSTPRDLREVKTQKEFASSVGVCEDTLTDWKHHPKFAFYVQKNISGWIKDRIPEVINSLYEQATGEGKIGHIKMFLQLGGVDPNK